MTRESAHPYDVRPARATTPASAARPCPAAGALRARTAPRPGNVAHAPEHAV
ncbi:hypothetical protein QOM21_26890 [Streptomyces sp. Pv4-95]|uniref:hypothetical protein n=1 Tax=Streptomyces sp. Pv4-95 TaxID=3049543 RepID=UPI0038911D51